MDNPLYFRPIWQGPERPAREAGPRPVRPSPRSGSVAIGLALIAVGVLFVVLVLA